MQKNAISFRAHEAQSEAMLNLMPYLKILLPRPVLWGAEREAGAWEDPLAHPALQRMSLESSPICRSSEGLAPRSPPRRQARRAGDKACVPPLADRISIPISG